jgi:hypothetical protein
VTIKKRPLTTRVTCRNAARRVLLLALRHDLLARPSAEASATPQRLPKAL